MEGKEKAYYSRPFWGYLSPVFRRSVVSAARRFPEERAISAAEEAEFHLRVRLLELKVEYLDEILALHRIRPGSITHDTKSTIRECSYAAILMARILYRHRIGDSVEWRYMMRRSVMLMWRAVRYAKDVRAFMASAAAFAYCAWVRMGGGGRMGMQPRQEDFTC